MSNGWTPERKARQAELIRAWSPWKCSTGPRTESGKATVAQNAWKGGHRAQMRELRRALAAQLDALDDWQFRAGLRELTTSLKGA
jgi:hypothetical protein